MKKMAETKTSEELKAELEALNKEYEAREAALNEERAQLKLRQAAILRESRRAQQRALLPTLSEAFMDENTRTAVIPLRVIPSAINPDGTFKPTKADEICLRPESTNKFARDAGYCYFKVNDLKAGETEYYITITPKSEIDRILLAEEQTLAKEEPIPPEE